VAFCLDEYYPIHTDDPRSYAAQMASLAAELRIPGSSLRIPCGETPRERVGRHCAQYEEQIRAAGGIDLQLLGVGRSGHIGFNEPGASPESRTRLVRLDDLTRQDAAAAFGGLDHVPAEAVTMGVATILQAEEIALVALSESKAEIVRRLVEEPPSPAVPASFLQAHDRAVVYLDADAASRITSPSIKLR
jgi:glucosamine-6-phosphate deaminase